jgi:hypothetical protein
MNMRIAVLSLVCIAGTQMAGCVAPPSVESAPRPAQAEPPPVSALEALEKRHREFAQSYAQERNWPDALVQWELLALLQPESQEYRNAVAQTHKRIRDAADRLLRHAEQTRRQGKLDQATLLYLRVLNVDRENTAAAQALRDITAERTRRAYINRPPRGMM